VRMACPPPCALDGSAAVMASFFVLFPWIGLEGGKGALEECVVDYVGFAVLAFYNPVAFGNVAESDVGGDGFGLFALGGVYEKRSKCTECTHKSSVGG